MHRIIFTNIIIGINRTAYRSGIEPYLEKPVMFVGFLFGMMIATILSSYALIVLQSSFKPNTFSVFLSFTAIATVLVLSDFLQNFVTIHKRVRI
jgi:hypothetical protein